MNILLIDNYDSFTYNLLHYIEDVSMKKVDVVRNDKITLKAIEKYDIIILSPGPGLPKDAGILLDVIKHYSSTKRILGVCLGMQAIGEVFGGRLKNLNQVYHGVATNLKIIESSDLLFNGIPQNIQIGRYHSWVVDSENFPLDLKITSIDDNGQIMSLKHQTYQLYGVQFHPESILTEYGKEIIANFLAI
ncbi:MAG: aminodeoxychorismate/anthranilate synthase component II [Flavobacteriales bacterium]